MSYYTENEPRWRPHCYPRPHVHATPEAEARHHTAISPRDRTFESIRSAGRILILGHSIHASDSFFCDMVRSNRHAEITLIDRDLDVVCRHLCNTLQLSPNRYTTQIVQGHHARKYDNRITVVQADLSDIDLSPWLEDKNM